MIWETENADEVTIDNGIGKVDAKGEKHVEILKNTTYVMKAKNERGEITIDGLHDDVERPSEAERAALGKVAAPLPASSTSAELDAGRRSLFGYFSVAV